MMDRQLKVHGALFTVALIFGSNYTIAKEVMPAYIDPFGLVVIRIVFAAVFFGVLHRLVVKEKITGRADQIRAVACGITGIAINQLLLFKGLSLTSPINAGLLMVIIPVVVLLFSALLLKERMGWLKVAGIAVACTGAILLIRGSHGAAATGNLKGDVLIIINAVSYGIYLVLVKPLMEKYNAITVVSRVFSVGAVFVLPVGWAEALEPDYASFPAGIWAAVLFLIIAVTIITYLLNAWALQYANSSLVGAYIYLQPVIAIVVAVGFGKDTITVEKVLYALLIFAGVFLVSHTSSASGNPQKNKKEQAPGTSR